MGIMACANKDGASKSGAQVKKEIMGAKVFKQSCVLCHGENGKLGLNGSKDLTLSKISMEERIAIITNGKGNMVGFKGILNDEKIKAVAAYTLKLVKE